MSLEIPDFEALIPKEPETTHYGPENKINRDPEHEKYLDLKKRVIDAMSKFKDPSKYMISVTLNDKPSQKIIDELEHKKYIVKYEISYDGKGGYLGYLRIYKPGYKLSEMGNLFDVVSSSVNIDSQTEDKFKNIIEGFMKFNL